MIASWKKSYDKPRQLLKKQRHHSTDEGLYSQSYGFPSSHVCMWQLDRKAGWVLKNWCFLTVVLEKTLESPLDCKEIKHVNPKGNQSWIFSGRTDAEAPILWPPDAKSWLTGKDPDADKDWKQEEKRVTGWDGWMVSLTKWTRVWASSGRWWRTELQRVRHDWVTEQQEHVCHILFIRSEAICSSCPHSKGGLYQGMNTRKWGSMSVHMAS